MRGVTSEESWSEQVNRMAGAEAKDPINSCGLSLGAGDSLS